MSACRRKKLFKEIQLDRGKTGGRPAADVSPALDGASAGTL